MLKKDAESSLRTYDKAIRSLPLHTSTQRCDRCTCTHAHTHTHNLQSDTIAAGDCVDGDDDDDDDDDDNRPMLNAGFVFSGMAQVVI